MEQGHSIKIGGRLLFGPLHRLAKAQQLLITLDQRFAIGFRVPSMLDVTALVFHAGQTNERRLWPQSKLDLNLTNEA
jgi:hypothetical protein